MMFKIRMVCLFLLITGSAVFADTEPVVEVKSAVMRPGTPLMDVVFRVTDPDDATVKVRTLAFIDGVRSFANVIKPVTWAEGTGANIGDSITTGVDHTLTWNVGVDWDIDLGHLKFEVLCRDSRGLLAFDWITIPAAGGYGEMTISGNAPTDTEVLNALFWQYAAGDAALSLSTNGVLCGNAASGVFDGYPLVKGAVLETYAPAYVSKQMNLQPVDISSVKFANDIARAGLADTGRWHAFNKSYEGTSIILGWGNNDLGQLNISAGLSDVINISAGNMHNLALTSIGTVVAWGANPRGQCNVPRDLNNVSSISAGYDHSLAVNNGMVVAWGYNYFGQCDVSVGLSNVTAVAAGMRHSLALKSDGTVVAWGDNTWEQCNVPAGLSNVTAIATKCNLNIALLNDGTVIGWGRGSSVPSGLSNVTEITMGDQHGLALKSDGAVVAWGENYFGQCNVPAGLSNVTAIAAGQHHSMALKSDGTVVAWGDNGNGQCDIPVGLSDVTAIAVGARYGIALKTKQP
jgi:hypothetical protein